jgi:hypothetical protein
MFRIVHGGANVKKSRWGGSGIVVFIVGVVLLHMTGPDLWRALPESVRTGTRTALVVAAIGFFIYVIFWSLAFLRAPDAERKAMEARVLGRLRRFYAALTGQAEVFLAHVSRNNPVPPAPPVDDEPGQADFGCTGAPKILRVEQSRAKILAGMLGGVLFVAFCVSAIVKQPGMSGPGRAGLVIVLMFSAMIVVRHLLLFLFARPLVEIGPMGLAAPAMYRPVIRWEAVIRVELTARRSRALPSLYIEFAHPEGPAAWRGLRGKVYGYFLRGRDEASLTIPLAFSDHTPEEICRAINHYLLDRGTAVVVRWVRSLHGENHADI